MPTITSEVIDPSTLDLDAKQALLDELHTTHAQIFDGVSRSAFTRYVVDSPAERTRIEVFRDRGRVVGYLAVHTFVRELDGQRWVILRCETGKLPAYRRNANGGLLITEVLRVCALYPNARKALLGCFVHPSSYVALGHCASEMYPHWERPTPPELRAAMHTLGDGFGLESVQDEAACSGVREVGWITRESEAERAAWAQRDCAMTRLFLRNNPGYVRGHGLLILVPLGFGRLIAGSLRYLCRKLARRFALTGATWSPTRSASRATPTPPASVAS